jgi:multiple sugar transport system substrate-binding protein
MMMKVAWLACTSLVALTLGAAQAARAADTELHALFMAQAGYSEPQIREMTAAYTKMHPEVKVDLEFVPYESLHDKIMLSKGSAHGYDVVLFDTIWPAEFATKHVLADVSDKISPEMKSGILPGTWTTVTYKDHYYGLPWGPDSKYLFYNKDMLAKAGITEIPTTWEAVAKDSAIIKAKGIVQYPIVWSWSQNEAMICDYTTLLAAFGGKFINDDGTPAFQTGGGLKALQYMVDSLKSGISNPHSTEYLEEDARRVFSAGKAAFALNWTYMWDMAQNQSKESQVTGQVGVEVAPGAEGISKFSSVNGAMGLGVPTDSKNRDAAWDYITYLGSEDVENKYAALAMPVWKDSYTVPAVIAGRPALIEAVKTAFTQMYPRPTVANYQQFSAALQTNIQQALLGKVAPQAALQAAADSLNGD